VASGPRSDLPGQVPQMKGEPKRGIQDFQGNLECPFAETRKMLTEQLRELERHGLVTRTVYAEVPPRVEYAATPAG
jgi:DNA-binding HxlR family transcriptional regulator